MSAVPYCSTCKATDKPLLRNGGGGNGKYHLCRDCNRAHQRRYISTAHGKAAIARTRTKYNRRNPERVKAWNQANYRIPQQPCEVCGDPKADRHHDRVERTLDVIFLCRVHHKLRHKLIDHGIGLALETTN